MPKRQRPNKVAAEELKLRKMDSVINEIEIKTEAETDFLTFKNSQVI